MAKKQGRFEEENGVVTSGERLSYWIESADPIKYEPLSQDIKTDVLIVGGGIAGLLTAYQLSKHGRNVIVIDDGLIGSGETGRTSAHVSNALDDLYSDIEKMLGEENAKLAAESHTRAIDFIEEVIKTENIECDFQRVDGFLFLHPSDEFKTLEEELHASNRAGVKTEMVTELPGMPSNNGPFLKFPGQAQFHPMKFLKGVADAIVRHGGKIFTETRAESFNKSEVRARGFSITANSIVVATNTPVNDLFTMHTKQYPYRTYIIGALVPKEDLPYALWWDTGDRTSKWVSSPYHYVRLQEYNDWFNLLIAGGEDHKTGQSESENLSENERYENLIRWTKEHFPSIQDVVYKWSGQVMEPVDLMGFIGRNPGQENVYIVTGDSGNGLTHGAIAGMLITDLIEGKSNPWEKLYDPSRVTIKAGKDFLEEVGNMAIQYLDYLSPADIKSLNELRPGQGATINFGAKKAAVYRDENNVVHAFSAVCPHLGCVVQWNTSEKSFDCPCHGSRFTCFGKMVNGPADTDLKKIILKS